MSQFEQADLMTRSEDMLLRMRAQAIRDLDNYYMHKTLRAIYPDAPEERTRIMKYWGATDEEIQQLDEKYDEVHPHG